jgi:hypothetical protein
MVRSDLGWGLLVTLHYNNKNEFSRVIYSKENTVIEAADVVMHEHFYLNLVQQPLSHKQTIDDLALEGLKLLTRMGNLA